MSYQDRIRAIKEHLATLRDEQYVKNEYTPVIKAYQSRQDRGEGSNYHVKQLCRTLKMQEGPEIFDQDSISLTQDNIFNLDAEEVERIPWSKMEVEQRVQMVEDYLSTAEMRPPIDDDAKNQVIQLVQDGLLKKKTDIKYDEVNKKIVGITILKYDTESNKYIINNINKKQQEIRRKKIKSILG